MRSVELFAGAGGLALGVMQAGFEPAVTVEWDKWACDTIRENHQRGFDLVQGWDVREADVRTIDWSGIDDVDLVTGGPPCQPFSMGGKARSHDDPRDMFPATAEIIRTLKPKAFLIENVRGLTRASFANYFEYIKLRLAHPANPVREGETWDGHLRRLQGEHTTADADGLRYNVVANVVNAADYGVPQQRHRVFFVGFRDDLNAEFEFPKPSHSLDALLYDQWVSGEYWERHSNLKRRRRQEPFRFRSRIARLNEVDRKSLGGAWRTVRDELHGLPAPRLQGSVTALNHQMVPGARSYPGHTGSTWDQPAKALKAGDHGVPGGENMLRRLDGSVRYFTVRECARLQTFPDEYELHGAWGEAMRQLGNAVPVRLAQTMAEAVKEHLLVAEARPTSADQRHLSLASSLPTL